MERLCPAVVTLTAHLMVSPLSAALIHVNPAAGGNGSGASWLDAVPSLTDALATAVPGDEVWVAEGWHQAPTPTLVNPEPPNPFGYVTPLGNRTAAFVFPAGVTVRGGFAGTESSPGQRDLAAHPSTLVAGCLDGATSEFVYKAETTSVLDGFTIDGLDGSSGGMFGAILRDCRFVNCRAETRFVAGLPQILPSALITTGRVERCVFEGNISAMGPAVQATDAVLIHCQILGNRNLGDTLQGVTGGGVAGSRTRLESCLVAGNTIEATRITSSSAGAGASGSLTLINCTVVDNVVTHPVPGAAQGGGAYLAAGGAVRNSVFWGNAANSGGQIAIEDSVSVTDSAVQGGFPGPGNSSTDPLFADPSGGDYRLTGASAAREAGSLAGIALLANRDLDGKPRVIDADADGEAAIDLGAYEFGDYTRFLGIVIGPARKARLDIESSLAGGLRVEASTNLVDWVDLGAPAPNGGQWVYRDEAAPGLSRRTYRIVAP